ncbi:MAG: ATP-dependent helicase HrpB [Bacteroidetes bacterium]|nr:MAG: ATP-dependent helicase HrpB [Bacteroidota bacterium]REK00800.1 MAG: ATP-dependent helicase HrpB [Bacteroidota bacterium]REK48382.1 MAG: ATP-dependent helicase HrpB [Bacteroidota bacterium]
MSGKLPIYDVADEVLKGLESKGAVLLTAPPGAGKSTALPLLLMNENWLDGKKIIMLQPRRLAAKNIAHRLSEQLNEQAGESCGYRIRFDTKVGARTKVEVVTEGILTRILQKDNALEEYGLVIFDEFHERNLNSDLALALCLETRSVLRPDLRLLIMSATISTESLSELLPEAEVVKSEGKLFPVDIRYAEQEAEHDIGLATAQTVKKALSENPHGDILVFLPGAGEIRRSAELLRSEEIQVEIHELYGDLPYRLQEAAILPDPHGRRKIILSTSIAETSLTIEGVSIVVDSGYSRTSSFDAASGMSRLVTHRLTKDSADQRAGRAGRLGPGTCYRMWHRGTHQHLREHRLPEIAEADLCQLLLELFKWGCSDPYKLKWLSPPPNSSVDYARSILESLGALQSGKITRQGMRLLDMPTHPRISHMLLYGEEHGIGRHAADIAAVLEERDPLKEKGCDINLRLEALWKWRKGGRVDADRRALERIQMLSDQWMKYMEKQNEENLNAENTGLLLFQAYPERIARKDSRKGKFRLANGKAGLIPETDHMHNEEWITVAHMDFRHDKGKIFLSAAIDPSELLAELKFEKNVFWDYQNDTLISVKEKRIGSLLAETRPDPSPEIERTLDVLVEVSRKYGMKLFSMDQKAEQFRSRVMSVKKWNKDDELPDLSDESLLRNPEVWLAEFAGKIKVRADFNKIPMEEVFRNMISWDQTQKIGRLAPEKIEVPSGSSVSVEYFPDGSDPVLAVRLQEMFGLADTPSVNDGKVKLLLHLLSPGYKPVQVTQDLRSFWNNTYQQVRKELRVRYPKHSWPEDPWTAVAVRGARRSK